MNGLLTIRCLLELIAGGGAIASAAGRAWPLWLSVLLLSIALLLGCLPA
jgi:hypothetical protein